MVQTGTSHMAGKQAPAAPPWGWGEAIVLNLLVLLFAFAVQWRLSGTAVAIAPPWNWVIVLGIIAVFAVLAAIFRRQEWMRWLSGPRFAIVTIAVISVLAMAGTFIHQEPGATGPVARLGWHRLFTSVPFLMSGIMMLVNLTTVLTRRLIARRPGILAFALNHGGLMLVIVAMIAGSAHFTRAQVRLIEGMPAQAVFDDRDREYSLGATLELQKFEIEYFPPQLLVAHMGEGHQHEISKEHVTVAKGQAFDIEGIRGRFLQYYPHADFDTETMRFVPSEQFTGFTAAEIETMGEDGKPVTGWLASGSALRAPTFAMIDRQRAIYMSAPMPKTYRSTLTVSAPGEKPYTTTLEVNKPLRVGKWWLYQHSYEPMMHGMMMSVLQAVDDPVLPLAYAGFIAMLVGVFISCWFTRSREPETAETTGEVQS